MPDLVSLVRRQVLTARRCALCDSVDCLTVLEAVDLDDAKVVRVRCDVCCGTTDLWRRQS
jgi:hypothetical protein